jgi:hypothetical protein
MPEWREPTSLAVNESISDNGGALDSTECRYLIEDKADAVKKMCWRQSAIGAGQSRGVKQ